MKQILLAISRETPSRKAFSYALDLSRKIRAELGILRFMEKRGLAEHFPVSREKAARLGRFLEDSFADVALAEEGMETVRSRTAKISGQKPSISTSPGEGRSQTDPLRKLLTADDPEIRPECAAAETDTDTDLTRFVDTHRDVVLTILDSPDEGRSPAQAKARIKKLKRTLGVPLVVIKPPS